MARPSRSAIDAPVQVEPTWLVAGGGARAGIGEVPGRQRIGSDPCHSVSRDRRNRHRRHAGQVRHSRKEVQALPAKGPPLQSRIRSAPQLLPQAVWQIPVKR